MIEHNSIKLRPDFLKDLSGRSFYLTQQLPPHGPLIGPLKRIPESAVPCLLIDRLADFPLLPFRICFRQYFHMPQKGIHILLALLYLLL